MKNAEPDGHTIGHSMVTIWKISPASALRTPG